MSCVKYMYGTLKRPICLFSSFHLTKVFRHAYKYLDPEVQNDADTMYDENNSDDVQVGGDQRSHSVNKSDLQPYSQFKFQIQASTSVGPGVKSIMTNITCDTPTAGMKSQLLCFISACVLCIPIPYILLVFSKT